MKVMLRFYGLLLFLNLVWTHGPDPGSRPGPGTVFLARHEAQQVLIRRRRANSFLEEMKKGSMERECVEERCSYEEAREIFEDRTKTDEFWAKYFDGDACESRPCLNAGLCKDTVGGFTCFCQNGFQGSSCEIVIPELCESKNGDCDHFCEVVNGKAQCSCADGYFLSVDEKSCDSNEPFKCGVVISDHTRTIFRYDRNQTQTESWTNKTRPDLTRPTNFTQNPVLTMDSAEINATVRQHTGMYLGLVQPQEGPVLAQGPGLDLVQEDLHTSQMATMTRIVNGENCPPGECPWQALLMNEEDRGFCGGTILNDFIILTAAHCMNQSRYIYVVLGEFDTLVKHGNEEVHEVEKVLIHHKYKPKTYHNDIALIKLINPIRFSRFILPACLPTRDFAEKVLMKEPDGLVSGFGRLGESSRPSTVMQRLAVPYVERQRCLESTQFRISQRMFCAGYETGGRDACQGDSGGPHVTRWRGTYFVTGIVSWGEGCARKGKYGVYTQVSKYLDWVRNGVRVLVPKRSRRGAPGSDWALKKDHDLSPDREQGLRGFKVLRL